MASPASRAGQVVLHADHRLSPFLSSRWRPVAVEVNCWEAARGGLTWAQWRTSGPGSKRMASSSSTPCSSRCTASRAPSSCPSRRLDGLMADGAGFAGFAAGPIGQDPSSPDILAIPDPASYTQLPWQPNVAVMQCDPTVEGELWPYAPRVILRKALESLADRNLVPQVRIRSRILAGGARR